MDPLPIPSGSGPPGRELDELLHLDDRETEMANAVLVGHSSQTLEINPTVLN